jgi:hypothetical protein
MRTNLLFFALIAICLAPVFRAQSGNTNLEGTWTINKVKITKTVDNTSAVNEYAVGGDKIPSFAPCPLKIIFSGDAVTFDYTDRQASGTYRLEGNSLHIDFPTHPADYTCTLTAEGIQLQGISRYVINDTEVQHQAEEQYVYYGQK